MVLAIIRGSRTAAITSGGPTQDFTISGLTDTPKLALVWASSATSLTGTAADERRLSIGLTDGVYEGGIGAEDEHGVTTTQSDHIFYDDAVLKLPDVGGTSTEAVAVFSAWIAGGIRLSWSTLPSSAYIIHVLLWMGDDIKVDVGTAVPDAVADPAVHVTTTYDAVDFEPDHLICLSTGVTRNIDNTYKQHPLLQLSHAVNYFDDTERQRNLAMWSSDAKSTSEAGVVMDRSLSQTFAGKPSTVPPWVFSGETSLDGTTPFDSTGFNIRALVTTAPRIIYAAISYGGKGFQLLTKTGRASTTGTKAYTGAGFRPWAVIASATLTGQGWTQNAYDATALGGTLGYGFFGLEEEFCLSTTTEDAVTTSNTQVATKGSALSMPDDTGSLLYEAALDSFDSDGFTMDFTTVGSTGARISFFVLEQDIITGTIAVSLEPIETAAAADEVFEGASALALEALSNTADADEVMSGSIAVALEALSSAAAAEEVLPGSIALALGALAMAASADEVFEGSSTLALEALETATAADLTFSGSIALNLEAIETTAAADEVIEASAAMLLEVASMSAVADEVFEGSSAMALGAMAMLASSGGVTGTADLTLADLSMSGVGDQVFSGTASPSLAPLGVSASGELVFSGQAPLSLAAMQASSAADEVMLGTATITLPPIAITSDGELVFIGVSTLQLPAIEFLAENALSVRSEMDGSYDAVAAFTASHDLIGALAGSYDAVMSFSASRDVVAALTASHDARAELAGGFGSTAGLG